MALIKQRPPQLVARLKQHEPGELALSSITLAELCFGISKSQHGARNAAALDQFLLPLDVVSFDEAAAKVYGRLRATLEAKGTPIGALDTLIASHALSLNATVVTNNTREFLRVEGLRVEDWIDG
jgi:tRNA(fMet)-specific endonuclease VapC